LPSATLSGFALAALCALLPAAAEAQDDGAVAVLASHTVVTRVRTLQVLPYKGLLQDKVAFRRVVKGLPEPPPAPDFAAGQSCLLVVADLSGGAKSWVDGLTRGKEGAVDVGLVRHEPPTPNLEPHLKAMFFVLAERPSGVNLIHRTVLDEGGGSIQRAFAPTPADLDPRLVPRLGADLRLTFEMADGSMPPTGVMLRYEGIFPQKGDETIPARIQTAAFPAAGLPFPRIRDGVRHVYAAYTESGLRSRNPLVVTTLPRKGPDGSPLPIRHRFVLEPAPK
jgi:hypothetical protein